MKLKTPPKLTWGLTNGYCSHHGGGDWCACRTRAVAVRLDEINGGFATVPFWFGEAPLPGVTGWCTVQAVLRSIAPEAEDDGIRSVSLRFPPGSTGRVDSDMSDIGLVGRSAKRMDLVEIIAPHLISYALKRPCPSCRAPLPRDTPLRSLELIRTLETFKVRSEWCRLAVSMMNDPQRLCYACQDHEKASNDDDLIPQF